MTVERAIAKYQDLALPEHQGNPLLEALPIYLTDEEVVECLSFFPPYSEEICEAKDNIRLQYLSRLEVFRQPLNEYLACFRMIEKGIKRSLTSKNPLSASTNYKYFYSKLDTNKQFAKKFPFNSDGLGMSLIGASGVGKSKMLQQICNYYDSVIEHRIYRGTELNILQIPTLFVECPSNGTPKGLCIAIINGIHRLLGLPMRKLARKTQDELLEEVSGYVNTYFLGVLIIDEVQKLAKTRVGADVLQDFLLSLINETGVSVLFCGNEELTSMFTKVFRNARRAEAGGVVYMRPMMYIKNWESGDYSLTVNEQESCASWDIFSEALWDYQWTRVYTELSVDLKCKLHELSKGNIDIAVRTFQKAQELLIKSSVQQEIITAEVLELAFSEISKLTGAILEATMLRAKRPKRKNSVKEKVTLEDQSIIFPGDLTKPQHPEFSKKIEELINNNDLRTQINSLNKVRKALDSDNIIEYFKKSDMWAKF